MTLNTSLNTLVIKSMIHWKPISNKPEAETTTKQYLKCGEKDTERKKQKQLSSKIESW